MRALLFLFFAASALAQEQVGEQLARAFNQRDVPGFMRLVDADAVGRHVVRDMGLNAKDEESVRANIERAVRGNLDVTLRTLDKTQGAAKFMRNGTREGKPFALVRFDLGDAGIDYLEFYLLPSRRVEDWYVHAAATRFSASTRMNLATMFKTDSILYGLFGGRALTKSDEKPFTDLRTHLQAQDFVKAYRALTALAALEHAIGGEDGATQNLRGSLLLTQKRFPEAERACRRGMAVEPDLKAPYWCLISVALASQNGKLAVDGLQTYEKAFSVRFDPDKLSKEEEYREISRTPEYGAWAKARRGR